MTFNQLYDKHLNNPYLDGIKKWNERRYFKIKIRDKSLAYPISNHWWWHVRNYFKFDDISVHKHKYLFDWDRDIKDGGKYLDYDNRHVVYIHTSLSICCMPKIGFSIGNNRYSFWPRSNREITQNSIIDEVYKYIDNVIYYPENTEYGAMQRLYGLNKQQLKERLRNKPKFTILPVSDSEAIRAIRRKYGYTTSDWVDPYKFVSTAIKLYKQRGKGKNKEVSKVKVNIPYDFDGDIDEAESLFNEAYSDAIEGRENQILILN